MTESWLTYFVGLARQAASKSKDPSTKVGCVVVDDDMDVRATGFNGFPRRVDDGPERYADKDGKLLRMVHAEANAIASAARSGKVLKGCTLIATKFPCPNCTALIIQSGIMEVIAPPANDGSRWADMNAVSVSMLAEAGVRVTELAA